MTRDPNRSAGIEALRNLPEQLEAAVRDLPAAALDTPYREGGWTVRQVVHHLADSHMNAYVRTRLILTEDRPTLKPYDQNAWAELTDARSADIGPSVAIVRGLHERWCALLEAVPDDAWTRRAYHPERGDMTLDRIVGIYAKHGAAHVGQILGLREARKW